MRMTLGQFVQRRRAMLGITAEELGNRIDRDHSYISNLENDKYANPPKTHVMVRLAQELQVPESALLDAWGYNLNGQADMVLAGHDRQVARQTFLESLGAVERMLYDLDRVTVPVTGRALRENSIVVVTLNEDLGSVEVDRGSLGDIEGARAVRVVGDGLEAHRLGDGDLLIFASASDIRASDTLIVGTADGYTLGCISSHDGRDVVVTLDGDLLGRVGEVEVVGVVVRRERAT